MPIESPQEREVAANYLWDTHEGPMMSGLYTQYGSSHDASGSPFNASSLLPYFTETQSGLKTTDLGRLFSVYLFPQLLRVPDAVNLTAVITSLERSAITHQIVRTGLWVFAVLIVIIALMFQIGVCAGKLSSPRLDLYWTIIACIGGPAVVLYSTSILDMMNVYISEEAFTAAMETVEAAETVEGGRAAMRALIVDILLLWQTVRETSHLSFFMFVCPNTFLFHLVFACLLFLLYSFFFFHSFGPSFIYLFVCLSVCLRIGW